MVRNIRRLGLGQRIVIFTAIFGGGLMLLVLLFVLLVRGSLNERTTGSALAESVTVAEFAALPDEDAYPAAIAVGADGTVYTGSYASGVIWALSPGADGSTQIRELPGTRDGLAAVRGLAAAPDGSLFVIDENDSDYRTSGGLVRRISLDGGISDFANISGAPYSVAAESEGGAARELDGLIAPHGITLDAAGYVYVTDRVRQQVWRFAPDGSGGVAWWTAPFVATGAEDRPPEPTGIAYDTFNDALIVADAGSNALYRIPIASAEAAVLYRYSGFPDEAPLFDGVTVAPDGTVYTALLGQNLVARLEAGTLVILAGSFRGSSGLAFNPLDGRLYVTNFDSASLAAPAIYERRLPFTVDVITLHNP